jgi:hypothetical protein
MKCVDSAISREQLDRGGEKKKIGRRKKKGKDTERTGEGRRGKSYRKIWEKEGEGKDTEK